MPPGRLSGGGLVPRFGRLTLAEANALLLGLHAINVYQLQHGAKPVSPYLYPGPGGLRVLRYIRRDPLEHWRNIREIWAHGGGDCEDLAAAVSAELAVQGVAALPRIMSVRPGLAHGVVEVFSGPLAGRILDPSKTGGMGEA